MRYTRRRPLRLEMLEILLVVSILGLLVLGSGAAFAQPLRLPDTRSAPACGSRASTGEHDAGPSSRLMSDCDDSTVHTSASFDISAISGLHTCTASGACAASILVPAGLRPARIIGASVESSPWGRPHR